MRKTQENPALSIIRLSQINVRQTFKPLSSRRPQRKSIKLRDLPGTARHIVPEAERVGGQVWRSHLHLRAVQVLRLILLGLQTYFDFEKTMLSIKNPL
jgi:hypothetical protein